MNGEVQAYIDIAGNSTITDLLSDVSGIPCVSKGVVEPKKWDATMSTISISSGGVNRVDNWTISELTCHVRASSEKKIDEIAEALVSALNRKKAGLYGMYTVSMLQTIPPASPEDSFNKPVLLNLRSTKEIE